MIFYDDLLACARLGGVNMHPALLPHNHGCNPTQWVILNDEPETGVTLNELNSRFDTVPIIDQQVPIFFNIFGLMYATDYRMQQTLSSRKIYHVFYRRIGCWFRR